MAKRKRPGHSKKKQPDKPQAPVKPKYAQMMVPGRPVPHVCDQAGRCCWGRPVGLSPFDVWRMMSSGALRPYEYNTTSELTHLETGAVRYQLGPSAGLPIAFIRQVRFRAQEGAAMHCPFVKVATDDPIDDADVETLLSGELPTKRSFWAPDGKPRFKCTLGRAKPSECVLFPMYRGGEFDPKKDVRQWQFISDTGLCRRCMVTPVRKGGTNMHILQWVERCQMELEYTKDYIAFNYMVARFIPEQKIREDIARTIFDWHTIMLEQGCPPERLMDAGPSTPGEVLGGGMAIINFAVNARRAAAQEVGARAAEGETEEKSLIIKP